MFNDRPFAIIDQICPTCSGILQTGYTDKRQIEEWLCAIRFNVEDVMHLYDETIADFFPICNLLPIGLYSLGIVHYGTHDAQGKPFLNQFGKRLNPSGLEWSNGPYGPQFLCASQPRDRLSERTVSDYIATIESGREPFGIALWIDGFLSLLLDGHHKAQAYTSLSREIPCLTISRMKQIRPRDAEIFYAAHSEQQDPAVTKEELKFNEHELLLNAYRSSGETIEDDVAQSYVSYFS